MCMGDDVNCPDFEAHFQQFKEEINPGRRGFLGAGLAGAGSFAAGGLSLVTPALAQSSKANGRQPRHSTICRPIRTLCIGGTSVKRSRRRWRSIVVTT